MLRTLAALALGAAPAHGAHDDDAAGARGRDELAALLRECRAALKPVVADEPEPHERAFGLPLVVVEGNGVRVLAAGGDEEEARRVAEAMAAARALFGTLTGLPATFPGGVSAFLLGTPAAKEAFLGKHPRLGPEAGARLAKLEGAGVPGTADWAWWEGDAERRLDGLVRFSFDWLFRAQGITLEQHAWLHEGLGFYLTHAVTGTYLTWFVRPGAGSPKRAGANAALLARMEEPGVDWMELAHGLFAPVQAFDLEELLHLAPDELEAADHVRVQALAGYLVEVHRSALGAIVARVGQGEDPRAVLEEALGFPFDELRARLDGWLAQRAVLVARAAGRLSEGELRALWAALDAPQQVVAVAALRRRVAELDTQQLRWLRAALARSSAAPLPPGANAPYFDPKVHAPGQPIARKRLPAGHAKVKPIVASARPAPEARAPRLAFDYDWGRGAVVRVAEPDEPEAVFENALAGLPPDADLARARVLALLDRPEERALQAAFAHAYTDRDGNVYPVTLYDMWATGTTMEMPDVDTLGIVHEVLDEWQRWKAPVPATQHGELYKTIGDLFQRARRARELRLTLAELYLAPSAVLRKGYETQTLNLQALWAALESDPARLAPELPASEGWEAFLAAQVERCKRDPRHYALGRRRAAQLRRDAEALLVALGAALEEARTHVPPSTDPDPPR